MEKVQILLELASSLGPFSGNYTSEASCRFRGTEALREAKSMQFANSLRFCVTQRLHSFGSSLYFG